MILLNSILKVKQYYLTSFTIGANESSSLTEDTFLYINNFVVCINTVLLLNNKKKIDTNQIVTDRRGKLTNLTLTLQ